MAFLVLLLYNYLIEINYGLYMFEKLKAMFNQPIPEPIVWGEDGEPMDFNKNQVFHGSCLSCTSQRDHGVKRCNGCLYQKWDRKKPDLSINDDNFHLGQWVSQQTTANNSDDFSIDENDDEFIDYSKPQVFHGGCLSCTSQRDHDVKRCNGCQYQKAEWNKPNLAIRDENFHLSFWLNDKYPHKYSYLKPIEIITL